MRLAASYEFLPVILGDLFDRYDEDDAGLIAELQRMLEACPIAPVCLAGNHDLEKGLATESCALVKLGNSGFLSPITQRGRLEFTVFKRRVSLWGIPYGEEIPKGLRRHRSDVLIILTHTEVNMDGFTFGRHALEPFDIRNVALLANGHIHAPLSPCLKGGTVWLNPGSLVRVKKEEPLTPKRLWAWAGSNGSLRSFFVPE